jgi:hypothetical protein
MNLLHKYLCVALLMAPAVSCAVPNSPSDTVSSTDTPPPPRSSAEGVTGEIKDDSGRALDGAMIIPKSLEANGPPIPEIAILSDTTGRYRWPLRPGNYDVTVRADGYQDVTRRVTVSAGAVETLDFVLRRIG